jgi:hypothetical protein
MEPDRWQLGFPIMPKSGSQEHFEVIRQWLQHCDRCHQCQPAQPTHLPTRVIDVGARGSPKVRLHIPAPNTVASYIALSHPWGIPDPKRNPHFCTYWSNIDRFANDGIDIGSLPATFRDAIVATRELGQQYLWIDSICIVQGQGGDFDSEAAKMEQVFSSAYCVLAASRATAQCDGFLKPRLSREVITLRRTDGGRNPSYFYVCEMIDDFIEHVLESVHSKRGWVFQERALARRTVYFGGRQTYWECGDGVRCETLAKMSK